MSKNRPTVRRIPKADFTKIVREFTRPGRPAFAALARELGNALGIVIDLIEPRKCDYCTDTFTPNREHQTYCGRNCALAARQKKWYDRHKKAA